MVKKSIIIITEEAVLKGYRYPREKLWRIRLIKYVQNENNDTIILNSKYWTEIPQYTLSSPHHRRRHRHSPLHDVRRTIYRQRHLKRVRPSKNQTFHQVPPYGGSLPNKTHISKSNPQRKLPNLASHHSKQCEQVFPRI